MNETTIQNLQNCLERLRAGDAAARDELINLSCARLTALTRKMLNDYSRLRQWEQTDDVSQNASIRLRRALTDVSPESVKDFFGLAALNIRRELQDLARHYYGRNDEENGAGVPPKPPARSPIHGNQVGGKNVSGSDAPSGPISPDSTYEGGALAQWTEFHEAVNGLGEKEREIVDLLFYHEFTRERAAELLGVDKSTVKRRWRQARLKLLEAMQDTLPDL